MKNLLTKLYIFCFILFYLFLFFFFFHFLSSSTYFWENVFYWLMVHGSTISNMYVCTCIVVPYIPPASLVVDSPPFRQIPQHIFTYIHTREHISTIKLLGNLPSNCFSKLKSFCFLLPFLPPNSLHSPSTPHSSITNIQIFFLLIFLHTYSHKNRRNT